MIFYSIDSMGIQKQIKKKFFTDYWHIGIIKKSNLHALFLSNQKHFLQEIYWLPLPCKSYQFWADPFIYKNKADEIILFVEFYDYRIKKGSLECLKLSKDFDIKEHFPILEQKNHLSFPSIFIHDDQLFMTPESHETNEIVLYQLQGNYFEPEKISILVSDVRAADPTLVYWQNYFYLFYTIERSHKHDELELHISYSDSLTGTWKAHHLKPIKRDNKTARNAGNFFTHEGKLYRSTQNCQNGYGRSISIMEVITLTPESYEETLIQTLLPPKECFNGFHTLNFYEDIAVIDARETRFTPFKWLMRAMNRRKR